MATSFSPYRGDPVVCMLDLGEVSKFRCGPYEGDGATLGRHRGRSHSGTRAPVPYTSDLEVGTGRLGQALLSVL